MTIKQKALAEVIFIYLIVGLAGWFTYNYFAEENTVLRFLYADLSMTIVTFLFSLLKRNSSVYDPYWTLIPFYFLIIWYVYFNGSDWGIYQWVCAAAVSFWSWRLSLSWARGWPGWHHEDWRYVEFRKQFGKFFQVINFLAIHLYPTVIVFLAMWGLFWVFDYGMIQNPVLFYIAAFLAFLGAFLELWGDNELARFRKRNNPKKEDILRTGIWAYSRNPNYLGEILFWFGVLGMGLAFGAPWYTSIGSIGMLLMFLFASIPMKEKQMRKNRPEAFAKYKNEVSVLFPRSPKK
jgi:steroid 5-alpha reductase family enzyme